MMKAKQEVEGVRSRLESMDESSMTSLGGAGSNMMGVVQVVVAAQVCGNALVDGLEQCDDGNTKSGNGCSADCKVLRFPLRNLCHLMPAQQRSIQTVLTVCRLLHLLQTACTHGLMLSQDPDLADLLAKHNSTWLCEQACFS